MAAVIEAVLGFGCAMKIDDDLQTSLSRPIDGGVEIWGCACSVRAPRLHITKTDSKYKLACQDSMKSYLQ
jgi:hypothetical protein